MSYEFLGKKISGRFTIPSGIVMTTAKIIEKMANEIPELGVITTKSIGLNPRKGNTAPIMTQYAPGCFMNAVGLTNPGAQEFVKQMKSIQIPKDRFVLTSIFGASVEEFVTVAKMVEQVSDGIELNLSCPHAKGYGMAMGQDPAMVKEIVESVKRAVAIPVVAKLTPNTNIMAQIAKAAVEGGADAICAINTVGPGYYAIDGNPALTNKNGGMSGTGILPLGLKCVREIRESVSVPIIGCGGISRAKDIQEYEHAGATIFGIGSALIGLTSDEIQKYFSFIEKDVENTSEDAHRMLKEYVDMSFIKYTLKKNIRSSDDFAVLVFDKPINIKPGQFVFVWIPGFGERAFSILDDSPVTLVVQKVGCVTERLVNLNEGDSVYIRGPYGLPITPESVRDKKIVLVAGGSGIAAMYQFARDFKNVDVFIGARDKDHLCYLAEFKKLSKVHVNIATNDGSYGHKGFVTQILKKKLEEMNEEDMQKGESDPQVIFFNCGPPLMIRASEEIEREFSGPDHIFSSPEYEMKCGVGICGSCVDTNGRRTCVDGPFTKEDFS